MLLKALEKSHNLLGNHLKPGDSVIDATCGNGHDTLFLAEKVAPNGCVYAVDIQKEAIHNTKKLLFKNNLLHLVKLHPRDHAAMNKFIPAPVQAVTFNLGYLPGGNHEITTRPCTTVAAINASLAITESGGIITVIAYHGHHEGKHELAVLRKYLASLEQKLVTVLCYEFINQINNPPVLFALKKH